MHLGRVMQKPSEGLRGCRLMLAGGLLIALTIISPTAFGRDDGRYANSPLKRWFDSLMSGKGLCCSMSDGVTLDDDDVETRDGHYRVRWGKHGWVDVPDSALITQPNLYGRAMVWPESLTETLGGVGIRCFIPGTGA
jgi:hypothetical protein